VAEGHHDDRRDRFALGDEIVHDRVGHAGLRPAALVVVGAVQQVEDGIALAARAVVRRRVDDDAARGLVFGIEIMVLDQVPVQHVANIMNSASLPGTATILFDAGSGRTTCSSDRQVSRP
jgi:hypothetical protein